MMETTEDKITVSPYLRRFRLVIVQVTEIKVAYDKDLIHSSCVLFGFLLLGPPSKR